MRPPLEAADGRWTVSLSPAHEWLFWAITAKRKALAEQRRLWATSQDKEALRAAAVRVDVAVLELRKAREALKETR